MQNIGNHFAINTYGYMQSMPAADCLRHLAGKGVRDFEMMFYPGHLWVSDTAGALNEIRSIIVDNHLNLLSMNTPNIDLNIAAATAEMRTMSLELNSAYLRIAGELGAKGLVLGPGKANPLFPMPREVLESHFFSALDTLLPLAEKCGVELWIENMCVAFVPDAAGLMALLERYGSDRLKICYDVANAYFISEDPVAGLATVSSRLAVIHVSDTTRRVYRHDAVGDGDIDFTRIPKAIAASGCERPVVLEIISHNADADIARSVASLIDAGF